MLDRPTPFSLAHIKATCPRREDPFEEFLPRAPGFITDFTLSLWNSEVPVAFSAWSAVWDLAMAVKREAWVRWFRDDHLFPNFYIILSGPPSSKKGRAISRAQRVYDAGVGPKEPPLKSDDVDPAYHGRISEPWVRDVKTHVPVISDFSTARPMKTAMDYRHRRRAGTQEGLKVVLRDSSGKPLLRAGRPWEYIKTSEIGIITEELSAFMGREDYNKSLVPFILAIYNTADKMTDRTAENGVVPMRRLCTSWVAGTTPTSFQDAVAETARGDGFFSRVTVVHQDRKYQRFFPPPEWPGLPTVEDLATRLAYVCEVMWGEHTLSPGAATLAKTWYEAHCDSLEEHPEVAAFWSRKDVQLLKLALLMKAQRYPPPGDQIITEEDLADSITLLEATARLAPRILEDASPVVKKNYLDRAWKQITKTGRAGISRAALMRNTHIDADEIDAYVKDLYDYGKIEVVLGGKIVSPVVKKTDVVYRAVVTAPTPAAASPVATPKETKNGKKHITPVSAPELTPEPAPDSARPR